MTWFARQLKTYSKAGTTVSYTYDANGLRATKTVNGTKSTYVFVNGLLTYEKRGDIEIYFWYDSYGHLMALRCFGLQNNNSYYYVLTNIQGDVLGIYDPTGELVVSYEYDTWGNVISMTDTSGVNIGTINPIRYRGYYFDEDTSLYYLQSRYYDPQVGRFINGDSIIDNRGLITQNIYQYCGNNPVIYCDPTGYVAYYISLAFSYSWFIGGGGVSFQLVIDDKLNFGLQSSAFGMSKLPKFGRIDFNASVYPGVVWGADDIYDLEGGAYLLGGSGGFLKHYGADIVKLPGADSIIDGIQLGAGFGIGAEYHLVYSTTTTIWSTTRTHFSKKGFEHGGNGVYFSTKKPIHHAQNYNNKMPK